MYDFEGSQDIISWDQSGKKPSATRKSASPHIMRRAMPLLMGLPGADPIYKVSIVPRGMAMGVTQLLPRRTAIIIHEPG